MPLLDLHAHFSFKPANSSGADGRLPDSNHWRERFKDPDDFSRLITLLDREAVKSSQLHGDAATVGGFRVVVNALYPLEKGFTSDIFNRELATLTGHDVAVLEAIGQDRIAPFTLLCREYGNLLASERAERTRRISAAGNAFRLVKDHNGIVAALREDPSTICLVNTVEGAHAFGDLLLDARGNPRSIHDAERAHLRGVGNGPRRHELRRWVQAMRMNIERVKTTWSQPPFFVTFAHHYYNHLCGHSPSLMPSINALCKQNGRVYDEAGQSQVRYFDLGMRSWGQEVMDELLSRQSSTGQPVRRILIDTKHMSPQARVDYYTHLVQRRQQGDKVPIVVSHSAVSGRRSLQDTIAHNNNPGPDFDLRPGEEVSTRYFYDGVINLFDDEIQRVVATDGIMGLMIDERRIMGREIPPEGGVTMATFTARSRAMRGLMHEWTMLKQRHAWGRVSDADFANQLAGIHRQMEPLLNDLRPAYLSVVFRQLFHIMTLVGERGWNHVALGTDYDGVINPIDIYKQSSDMARLREDLIEFWNVSRNSPDAAVRALYELHRYGQDPAVWVDKLLWGNGMDFLRKYYNDEYLLHGQQPII